MLIEIIKKVFTDNNCSIIPVEHNLPGYQVLLAVPNDKARQEYFLLTEHSTPTEEILHSLKGKDADYLFDLLSAGKHVDETFRKNCTMIFCCKGIQYACDAILSLEEDPYNFKKNVIAYDQIELESWIGKKFECLSVEIVNDLINADGGEAFRQFKEGTRLNDYYSLLLKIATKVPIVHYLPTENFLYDLKAEIKKNLPRNESQMLDFIVDLDMERPESELENSLLGDWKVTHG
jgi:hypothetical protein